MSKTFTQNATPVTTDSTLVATIMKPAPTNSRAIMEALKDAMLNKTYRYEGTEIGRCIETWIEECPDGPWLQAKFSVDAKHRKLLMSMLGMVNPSVGYSIGSR